MLIDRGEIAAIITEIEERCKVRDWRVDGVRVWPYLRVNLGMQINRQARLAASGRAPEERQVGPLAKPSRYLGGWLRQWRAAWRDRGANLPRAEPVEVLFVDLSVNRSLVDGRWYSRLSGPLLEACSELDLRSSLYELAPGYEYRVPRSQPSIYIQNSLEGHLMRSRPRPREDTGFDDYAAARNLVREKSACNLPSRAELHSGFDRLLRLASYWRAVLARRRPALVMLSTYYILQSMAVVLACKKSGVPVVDLQHGVQGELHYAYGSWNYPPADGYELLPDLFWVWSGSEKRAIEAWCGATGGAHRAYAGGNLWVEMWKRNDHPLALRYDSLIRGKVTGPALLITLQPDLDPPPWLESFLAENAGRYSLFVRLHPGMHAQREAVRRKFASLNTGEINLDLASSVPLPALLRSVDLHLTHYSSTVLEAAQFGLPSVVMHRNGELFYPDLVKAGLVVPVYDRPGLERVLAGIQSRSGKRSEGCPPGEPLDGKVAVKGLLELLDLDLPANQQGEGQR